MVCLKMGDSRIPTKLLNFYREHMGTLYERRIRRKNMAVGCTLFSYTKALDGTDASVSVDCRLAVLVADVRRLPFVRCHDGDTHTHKDI